MNEEDFDKCVTIRRARNADYIFECKKGLWSVQSYSSPKAYREARHYFMQYKGDGEYSDMIGGPTVLEVLRDTMTANNYHRELKSPPEASLLRAGKKPGKRGVAT